MKQRAPNFLKEHIDGGGSDRKSKSLYANTKEGIFGDFSAKIFKSG